MSHPDPDSFSGLKTRGDVPADRDSLLGEPLSPAVAALPDSTFSGQSTHSGSTSFSDLQAAADDLDEVEFEFVELSRRYEMQGELGQGGMGVVYRAFDRQLQRPVAIKRLKPEMVDNRLALARFQSEARSVAALSHENIVRIYRLGRDAIGPFLVLELVEGESLATRLTRGKLDLDEAIRMFIALAGGISLTHRHGIIHRDIKPGNILLTPEGVPKLSDFGIARQSNDSGLTSTAAAMGTLYYMAPEQHRDAHAVTEQSDLYSLAATFYHAVTGELPQVGGERRLPDAVRDLTLKALESDPAHRHPSVAEFAADLRAAQIQLAAPAVTAAADATTQEGECPACHVLNPPDRKFCKGCGKPLTEACPQCEQPSPVWERFCADCGTDIPARWVEFEQHLAEQAQQIETLSRDQRYAEALVLLEQIASLSSPRCREWRAWATDTAATLRAILSAQQSQLVDEARAALAKYDYAAAQKLLETIPAEQRSIEVRDLLATTASNAEAAQLVAEAAQLVMEAAQLVMEFDQPVESKLLDGLYKKTGRLLELYPDRADVHELQANVRKLHQQLQEREAHRRPELPPPPTKIEPPRRWPPRSIPRFAGVAVAAVLLVIGLTKFGFVSSLRFQAGSGNGLGAGTNSSLPQTFQGNPGIDVSESGNIQTDSSSHSWTGSRIDDATTSGFKAGDRRIVKMGGVDFTFRYCPPGTFQMGSPTTEAGHKTDENQVEVTLTQGFWMLETEVTQAMYYAFIKKEHPWQEESKTFANYPVTLVSRSDASDFCEKLTAAGRREGVLTTKQQITLPTEARWEYACRAGTTTAYSFGDNESGLGVSAWFTKNSYDIGEKYAHEVGRKQPNPWGLLDMHGNVREWCHECYNATLPGGRDPGGSAGGTSSVIRGGDWNGSADQARCSSRQQLYPPGRSGSDIGFRVIVESDTKRIATTSESAVAPASQSSVAPTQSGSSQPQGPVVSPANPKTVAKPPISKPATPLKTAVPEVPPSKVPEPNTPVVELDSVTAKIKKLTEDATAKFPKSPSKLSDAKLAAIRQDVEKNELEAISSAIDRDRTGREPKALVAVWYEYRASVYRLLGQATNALRDAEIAHDLKTASEVVDP